MFLKEFFKNVDCFPDKIAVTSGKDSITYQKLDRYSNSIADQLIEHGIKSGDTVAYYDKASFVTLASMIAIWKIAAIYVPIAINNPIDRVRVILEECNATVLITTEETIEIENIKVIHIEKNVNKTGSNQVYRKDNQPVDIAYIMLTSGSTGKPKGVKTEHQGLLNHLRAKEKVLGIRPDSRILQDASLGFVISIWQLLTPLLVGTTTYILDLQQRNSVRQYIEKLREYKIQMIEIVPSYMELLIQYIKAKKVMLEDLKCIVITGEKFSKSLLEQIYDCFPTLKIVNAYGATEVSDDVTHCVIDSNINYDQIPIGQAIDHMRIDILDEEYHPVPQGEIGNIVVTGIGVSQGYVNAKEANHNFSMGLISDKERSYITGDYGYIGKDGLVYYCGRKNSFVKVNGIRMDLGEIEDLLKTIDVVDNAVVLLQKRENREKSVLHAFVKLKIQKENAEEDICNELKKKAPSYMIPTYFTFCNEFPIGMNGKIDRNALSKKWFI